MVSFTSRQLYHRGKSLRHPLDRGLGGPRLDLDDVKRRNFLTLPELELQPLGRPPHSRRYIENTLPLLCRFNIMIGFIYALNKHLILLRLSYINLKKKCVHFNIIDLVVSGLTMRPNYT
jgi:hypothetical protein